MFLLLARIKVTLEVLPGKMNLALMQPGIGGGTAKNVKTSCLRKQTRSCKDLSRVAATEIEKEGIPSSIYGKYYLEGLLMNGLAYRLCCHKNKTENPGYTGA